MQTNLSEQAKRLPRAEEAERILRSCVHCGFCNATCPTYQLLGDELDGPRGRIYLIKQMLEGNEVTAKTQEHLDRCLTCRNCETTCPSGVQYHNLLDIGREVVEQAVPRPLNERLLRQGLRAVVPRPALFKTLTQTGLALRPLLPAALKAKLPREIRPAKPRPTQQHTRRVLMLEGCVQPGLSPNTNAATARVLDRLGISVTPIREAGCCGAVDYHLNAQEAGLQRARQNIDAWWPHIERGAVEAIVNNASGCGAMVKDYGHLLRHEPRYADRAAKVSELARDLSELLPYLAEALQGRVRPPAAVLGWHAPCTLQHGMQLRGGVEESLGALGFQLRPAAQEAHLCCGSAGTYSVLQPELATKLRDRKLGHLLGETSSDRPAALLSANIGCITHLQSGTELPVRHWIEVLDEALVASK